MVGLEIFNTAKDAVESLREFYSETDLVATFSDGLIHFYESDNAGAPIGPELATARQAGE